MSRADLRAALGAAMADVKLSEAKKAAILAAAKGERNVNKRQWTVRTTLVAAALCAVLAVTALAVSPTLRDALEGLLGGFAPYAQSVEGVSATDQGIRMTVVSAIADESDGQYYMEVEDLTGDRLTADAVLSGGPYAAAYDPEERTLLARGYLRNSVRNGDGTATVTVKEVWGGEDFEGVPLPVELLEPENVLKELRLSEERSTGTDDDRVALLPEQTPMELEGAKGFSLSSMGFDAKGRLHVQIKVAEGHQVPEWEFYLLDALQADLPCRVVNGADYHFEYRGGRYVDFRMDCYLDMTGDEYMPKEAYRGMEFTLEGWIGTKERVEGEWKLTFPLELLPDRTVQVDQQVNGKIVEEITLSAMSAGIQLTAPAAEKKGSLWGQPLTVYRADGSHFTVERGRGMVFDEDGRYVDQWRYPEPAEPDQVVAVAIGYWYIPLDGDKALPGHWLEALPHQRTIQTAQTIGGLPVDRIVITAESVVAGGVWPAGGEPGSLAGQPMTLYLSGGAVQTVRRGSPWLKKEETRQYETYWGLEPTVDPARVEGISIGGWYIPLDGDRALPGHWLEDRVE